MVCPEKRQAFANISLTRNTGADRISDILADLESQLKHKAQPFVAFSAATDESTDIIDVAQLAAFICGVDDTLTVAEELVELVPSDGYHPQQQLIVSLPSSVHWAEWEWTGSMLPAWLKMVRHPR